MDFAGAGDGSRRIGEKQLVNAVRVEHGTVADVPTGLVQELENQFIVTPENDLLLVVPPRRDFAGSPVKSH